MMLSLGVSWFVLHSQWQSEASGFILLLTMVFLANGVVLCLCAGVAFAMLSSEHSRMEESLRTLKDHATAIEQGKPRRGNALYFTELEQALAAIEHKVKTVLEHLSKQITDIDTQGISTHRQIGQVSVADTNLTDVHKKLERISKRTQQLFEQAGKIGTTHPVTDPDPWERTQQTLSAVQKEKASQHLALAELSKLLPKLQAGELNSRLRLNDHKELEKNYNDFAMGLDSYLREFERMLSSGKPMSGAYKGQFSNLANTYNRGLETHQKQLQTLEQQRSVADNPSKAVASTQTTLRRNRTDGGFKSPVPAVRFAEIDFSGKSFGKY